MRLKSTLEQWNTLRAINEFGSIQAASLEMSKSHTTLIYSIKKLEEQLDLKLLEVVGKKATLTNDGKTLLRHANLMLDQAESLEVISGQLSKGAESEITVTVDHLFNKEILYRALNKFLEGNSMTSVQILETSLTSTQEAVTSQFSDIAIITLPVTNYPAESIDVVSMIPVASKLHPIANRGKLSMEELTQETQIVLRDLGTNDKAEEERNVGWLKAKRRITVDTFELALRAVSVGLGFTRIPQYMYQRHKQQNIMQLEIEEASCYQVPIHITLPKGVDTGPAATELYKLIVAQAKSHKQLGRN